MSSPSIQSHPLAGIEANPTGNGRKFFQGRLRFPDLSNFTVGARIIVIVLILGIPLNLLIGAVIWRLSRAASDAQQTSLLYTARSIAAAVDAKLSEYMALAQALARSPALLETSLANFEVEARRVFASTPDALVLVAGLDGRQLLNTASRSGQSLPVRSGRGLAAQSHAFESHSTVISEVHFGQVSQKWVIHIEVPIFKDGLPFRTLVVAVQVQAFYRLLNDQQTPKNWLAAIVDGEGHFIARVPENERHIGQLASESWRKVHNQNGIFKSISLEGDRLVKANAHSQISGWLIGIAVKEAEMQSAAWRAIGWAIVPGGGMCLLSFFIALAVARSITSPIAKVRAKARALLMEATPAISAEGPPEVKDLWYALKQSTAERERKERALRESEAKLRLALHAAKLGIWQWDVSSGEIHWDDRCLELFGVSPSASVTHATWANCLVPEDRALVEANTMRALDPDNPNDDASCEYRITRPDGSTRWLSSTGRAFFEPDLQSSSGRRPVFMAGAIGDVTEMHKAQAALIESEDRFRGIFEDAATGIFITDMEDRFVCCNPAYAKMLGYPEDELRELVFPALVHPEDRERNVSMNRRLVRGEIPSFEIENRYIRKDGRPIWVHKHVSLLRDAARHPSNVLVLATDITERKRQEDQIRLLMREVNHRSKNLLSLVHAIARQTLAARPEDFLDRFGQRIEALAASQDLLVRNAWKGADLSELVQSQLAHFQDLIGTRIDVCGGPLFVSASAAQTIGMALHELATNAGKYGALANGEGRVQIAWNVLPECSGRKTFTMTWREQCSDAVAAPSKFGFGFSVISIMAEASLGAKVELGFPSQGLIWRLNCPIGEILGEAPSDRLH